MCIGCPFEVAFPSLLKHCFCAFHIQHPVFVASHISEYKPNRVLCSATKDCSTHHVVRLPLLV
jgi:hypothetical protein